MSITSATDAWRRWTAADLREVSELLLGHHPGPLDELNPAFAAWHEAGLLVSLDLAARVTTAAGYYFALQSYVAGFRDTHLTLACSVKPGLEWPGFLIKWHRERFTACCPADVLVDAPPDGAELVDFDGRSPVDTMEELVFPFYGNPALAASWVEWTPWLLLDRGNPWRTRPKECVFAVDGRPSTYRLQWHEVEAERIGPLLRRAQFGEPPEPGVRWLSADSVWISVPSFKPTREDDVRALREVVHSVSRARDKRFIVFDVRGNRGGNSQWGDDIVEALYGSDALRQCADCTGRQAPYEEWRVSEDNERYLRVLAQRLRRDWPESSPAVTSVESVADAMRRCLQHGEKLCSVSPGDDDRALPRSFQIPSSPQLVLLTDGRCGSACLDFVDRLLSVGNVRHVGTVTSADSSYGDVRSVVLPSGKSRLTFAMKVHRGRPRGNNVPYSPTYEWEGDASDSTAIEQWLMRIVAAWR